jgi:predicted ATPase with chaperone activity
VTRNQKRLSGPLLDRIDIHLDVPRVDYEKLASDRAGECGAVAGGGGARHETATGAIAHARPAIRRASSSASSPTP